jgi:hypothetical protein
MDDLHCVGLGDARDWRRLHMAVCVFVEFRDIKLIEFAKKNHEI